MTTTTTSPTLPALGLDALPQADQDAIGSTLLALYAGFTTRDVAILADVYAPDADWVNAFGTRRHGASEILDYLTGLFADANFDDGELAGPPEIAIRVVTSEVVVVSVHLVVTGQGLADGGTIAERDNFSVHVLARQADGRWQIVSEMYNDANIETTYVPE